MKGQEKSSSRRLSRDHGNIKGAAGISSKNWSHAARDNNISYSSHVLALKLGS